MCGVQISDGGAIVAWCRPYSFMRLFPPFSPSPSRRHLFVARENVEVKKKKKDDILTVVADLHRVLVFVTARKTAPKDSCPN